MDLVMVSEAWILSINFGLHGMELSMIEWIQAQSSWKYLLIGINAPSDIQVWKLRSSVLHHGNMGTEEQILEGIERNVRIRIEHNGKFLDSEISATIGELPPLFCSIVVVRSEVLGCYN